MTPTIILDTREPDPHPWPRHWPHAVQTVRAGLETGDLALSGLETGAVIERKTVPDFLACLGRERERFTKELLRARYVDRFAVVVEGTLMDLEQEARGLHPAAIVGTLAAWTRRGWPVVLAGNERLAALFALRFLLQPIGEAERTLKAMESKRER